MRIAFIRHGPTEWNEAGRIQGHVDIPLSEAGRAKIAQLAVPDGFGAARVFVSNLGRTQETARLLGIEHFTIDARLAEQNWGRWEGLTREEIRARDGDDAFVRAGTAHDFHPPGGESTRVLVARVRSFLVDVARERTDALAVSHLGVLRTAYTLASGWDMATPLPEGVDFSRAFILDLDAAGHARIDRLNVPLSARTDRDA